MCKLFMMTDLSRVGVSQKLIKTVRNEVCKLTDKDGFGYGVLGAGGSIGGERTLRPFQFVPSLGKGPASITESLPFINPVQNSYGVVDTKTPRALVAHGRFSTNSVSLQNTHPFVNEELALFHNGVVQDPDEVVENTVSTCDSEILLRHWERGGVPSIEKHVTGYYALGVLDSKGLLHVIRDNNAMLYVAWSRTANSFLIATTREIIFGVCKAMKWVCDRPEEILPNTYLIFEGNTVASMQAITPRGRVTNAYSDAELGSLGKLDYDANDIPAYREDAPQRGWSAAFTNDGLADDDSPEIPDEDDDDDGAPLSVDRYIRETA